MSDNQAFYEFMHSVNHANNSIHLADAIRLWNETKFIFENASKRTANQESFLDKVANTSPQVRAEMDAGRRIHAIKELREITKCGLKEAKESIDRVYRATD